METATPVNSKQRVVKTACGMCIHECGINVYVENDRIVKIEGLPEHPESRGEICVKAHQIPDWVYHEDRLKYPMRKGNGEWRRISWEEALDAIATKLKELKERDGASSLAVIAGDPAGMAYQVGWDVISRFCDVQGTPNIFDPANLCANLGFLASVVTIGKMCSPDLEKSRCIILWAQNPHKSFLPYVRRINKALRKGGKLIVINPKYIPFTKRADIHVQPRPGTDGALALAMLNTIISEGLYDREFVENWTVGFDKLAEHVKQYTAEWAEKITGVAADDIKKIARIYATTKPACISASVTKLQQCQCGFQNWRSLTMLEAITGHLDIPGGSVRRSSGLTRRPHRLLEKMGDIKRTGADKYPILHQIGGRMLGLGGMVNWGDLVLTGKPYPVKMMIISAANPVVTWPNSTKVKQALNKLEFLVVMDVFMTATAEVADIVLPACTFLEKVSATSMTHVAMLRRPVIAPLWESWSDCRFWLELAKRMGYEEYFPWKDDEEVLNHFLEPAGLTVKYLRDEHPTGILPVTTHYDEYSKRGFRTSSGKVELYSEELEKMGYDPLPTYQEPVESPISTPELARDYPLVLTTGARETEYWHSQHRNLSRLRRRNPEPMADIHADTAAKYGIGNGDLMVVETKRGSIEIKARVSQEIMPDVVSVPHGWPESCENVLTDDAPADPVTGYPAFTGLLARVSKKA
jgi:anaerobic selenocysteine-containing dehydrogenase